MILIIQLSHINHDIAMNISEKKEIDDIHNKQLFSNRVLAHHREKHIN